MNFSYSLEKFHVRAIRRKHRIALPALVCSAQFRDNKAFDRLLQGGVSIVDVTLMVAVRSRKGLWVVFGSRKGQNQTGCATDRCWNWDGRSNLCKVCAALLTGSGETYT